MTRPNFFIVGAPKCGTTSMYEYLRRHPDVFMPAGRKEAKYFCSDLEYWPVHLIHDEQQYLALFDDAGDARCVGEASPPYLYSEDAPRRIKAFNPAARIIIMLREPVDFMYSQHRHLVGKAIQDVVDFEAALEAGERRRRDGSRPSFCHVPPQWLWYRWMATFSPHVARYLEVFGRAAVHFVIFDDLAQRPAEELRAVLEFLDVDSSFSPELKAYNVGSDKKYSYLSLKRFLKSHPSVMRLLKLARAYGVSFWEWPPLRASLDRLFGRVHFDAGVDPALRARLSAEMAPEVERLGQLVGRDLSGWSR